MSSRDTLIRGLWAIPTGWTFTLLGIVTSRPVEYLGLALLFGGLAWAVFLLVLAALGQLKRPEGWRPRPGARLLVVGLVVLVVAGLVTFLSAVNRYPSTWVSVFAVSGVVWGISLSGVGAWRLASRVDASQPAPAAAPAGPEPATTAATPAPPPPTDTPEGWYPNPHGPGRRYWDGSAWTEHLAP